ncbi:MAG: IS3 family transposase [Oligoflexia bacterium]|nr:IS3 family transposase [Oligoflexia bacterium]
MIFKCQERVRVSFCCDFFGVSRSWFYKWRSRKQALDFRSSKAICEEIKNSFEGSKKTYGSPRVHSDLRDKGFKVSENTVAKYMKEMGLSACLKKRHKVMTTDSRHCHPVAERLFKAEEEGCIPLGLGEILAGDITYLKLLNQSYIYLAVVLDLYNREVLGWSMLRSLKTRLVLSALDMAMKKVGSQAEVIFHSDRGVQYASEAYRSFLKNQNIRPSMSRKGNCFDNAYVESFFSSLKKEVIYRKNPNTEEQMRQFVFEYIETWYNPKRKHSSLDMMSPKQYREFKQ